MFAQSFIHFHVHKKLTYTKTKHLQVEMVDMLSTEQHFPPSLCLEPPRPLLLYTPTPHNLLNCPLDKLDFSDPYLPETILLNVYESHAESEHFIKHTGI